MRFVIDEREKRSQMALTHEERHAINDLFARLQAHGPAEKDGEAEALINQLIRRTPDSAYMLVQCVLIEEAQVAELEERIRDLESQLAGGSRPASRGGFLGARRGSASASRDDYDDDRRSDDRRSDDRRSGIPPIGSRSGPSPYDDASRGPSWSGGRQQPGPGGGHPGVPPQQQQAGGGGFFRTAATMAAGVAGGALLANSLGGLFGGQKGEAQAGQNSGEGNDAGHQNAIDNDPGNYDAGHHDTGAQETDWGGGMDDFDI